MKKSTLIKFLILLITFSNGFSGIVVPILGTLGDAFPDVPASVTVMVNTISYLTAIPTSLLCATIRQKLGNKKMILISMVLMGTPTLPAIIPGFSIILITKALFGIGWGIIMTIPNVLVGDYLPASDQANFFGFVTAVMNLTASLFAMVGGLLAGNLRILWGSHLLIVVFVGIIAALFPADVKAEAEAETEAVAEAVVKEDAPVKKGKAKLPPVFFAMLILNLIISGVAVCGLNIMSFFVAEKGVGGAMMAGTLLSVYTFSSFFGGLATGICVKFFKKYTRSIGCLIVAVGYAVFTLGASVPALYAGCIIFGLACGVVNAMVYVHNSWVVPAEGLALSSSLTMGLMFAASFFLTYIPEWICALLGIEATYNTQFVVIGVTYVVIGLAFAILFNVPKVKKSVDAALSYTSK